MSLERYRMIEAWSEADLAELPHGETDEYEFKSSRIAHGDLIKEIQVAASAFWNSGGGVLIVGLDDHGRIDGGIEEMIGRQRLREWVDRVLSHVEPAGPYFVKMVGRENGDSAIHEGCVVLLIAFGESNAAPHMAPDKRYYVRAGSHSDPAGHFLVEAIRARRRLQKPVLRALLRLQRNSLNAVELVVIGLNDTPALDVRLSFDGLPPQALSTWQQRLPLYIPVIDRRYPFTMDASWLDITPASVATPPSITLYLHYQDLAGRQYQDSQQLDPSHNIAPLPPIDEEERTSTYKSLKEISRQLKRLRRVIEGHTEGHAEQPTHALDEENLP